MLLFETKCDNVKLLYKQIDDIAPHNINVLFLGETGTGKEILADLLQVKSTRADKPYLKINCTALPETMIESELFGYEKSAFTGAHQRRIGKFEAANGGTLFLDEIGDTSLAMQAKILRVVENRTFSRLGGNENVECDVRIVSATNKNIESEVQKGNFRLDLFYRLGGAVLPVPSLKQRQDDLETFLEHFRYQAEGEFGKVTAGFSFEAKKLLIKHDWPGNLREMQHVVKRAVVVTPTGDEIGTEAMTLRNYRHERPSEIKTIEESDTVHLKRLKSLDLEQIERSVVIEALARREWRQNEAAVLLGISPRALNYKISHYGLTHPTWKTHKGDELLPA